MICSINNACVVKKCESSIPFLVSIEMLHIQNNKSFKTIIVST